MVVRRGRSGWDLVATRGSRWRREGRGARSARWGASSSGRMGWRVCRMEGGGPGSEGGWAQGVRKSWWTSDTWMVAPSWVNVSMPGRGREERGAGEVGGEEWEVEQELRRSGRYERPEERPGPPSPDWPPIMARQPIDTLPQ